MVNFGLKSSSDPKQLESRLKYHPEVFEFYTSEKDFTSEGLERLKNSIEEVKRLATDKIILHHPMMYNGDFLEVIVPEKEKPELYSFLMKSTNALLQLAWDYNIEVLVHGSYGQQTQKFLSMYSGIEVARNYLYNKLDEFQELGQEHIMFENSISPLFYFGNKKEDEFIYNKGYRLAYDTSHALIKLQGNQKLFLESLERLKKHIVHYHLVDTLGKEHDSLVLGKGITNWSKVIPLLNSEASSIYEIDLEDLNNPREQVESHLYVQSLLKK